MTSARALMATLAVTACLSTSAWAQTAPITQTDIQRLQDEVFQAG